MGFSGNLVAFGFEDDIIIYEKLVEVIDNILVGLLQTYKPQTNPFSFSDFFSDPYQNIVFWSKGLFPEEFKQRISILLDDIQKLYNHNLNLHNRVRFIEYDEKHPEYKSSIYKMFNSTIYKMHFIPYTDSAVHIASDIYAEYYEQGYTLPDLETAEEGVFFFGFDGDEALAYVHTTNKLVEISFDNLYDAYHEL